MGAIHLIRHAQASFGQANYDELSHLGHKQSQLLGTEIEINKLADIVISGTMKRHRQTAEGSLEHSHLSQQITLEPGFDEFNHEDLIEQVDKSWKDKTRFRAYLKEQKNPKKAFHEIFLIALDRWISGKFEDEYQESWITFQTRVINALLNVRNTAGNSKNIFVFTSGGPISVILQWVLKLENKQTFEINENLANTGVTRLLYNQDRISVSYINNYSHLERNGSELLSFR